MKKCSQHLLLIILLAIVVLSAKSQDTIVLNTNEKLISIVTEVSDTDIRFKEFSNPSGPDYVIKKNSVDRIIFKNGQQKQFKKEKRITPYGRNIISYHLFDIVYQDFTISYENILKNGKVGFKIPLGIGFNNDNDGGPYQYKNLIYTGLGLNVYVTGQHIASYFMGPELQLGYARDNVYYYDYYDYHYSDKDFFYGRLFINNGVSVSPVPNLRLTTVVGIGLRYYDVNDANEDGVQSTAYFTFTMGYRF